MQRFKLVGTVGMDIQCPHCKKGLDVDEWFTDDGQPIQGYHNNTVCPLCENSFTLCVEIQIKYTAFTKP